MRQTGRSLAVVILILGLSACATTGTAPTTDPVAELQARGQATIVVAAHTYDFTMRALASLYFAKLISEDQKDTVIALANQYRAAALALAFVTSPDTYDQKLRDMAAAMTKLTEILETPKKVTP